MIDRMRIFSPKEKNMFIVRSEKDQFYTFFVLFNLWTSWSILMIWVGIGNICWLKAVQSPLYPFGYGWKLNFKWRPLNIASHSWSFYFILTFEATIRDISNKTRIIWINWVAKNIHILIKNDSHLIHRFSEKIYEQKILRINLMRWKLCVLYDFIVNSID